MINQALGHSVYVVEVQLHTFLTCVLESYAPSFTPSPRYPGTLWAEDRIGIEFRMVTGEK
jgi:hypothetical protein